MKKIVKIEGFKDISVFELSNQQIFEIFQAIKGTEETAQEFMKLNAENLFSKCCDLPFEKVMSLTPSQTQILLEAFREVNSSFFTMISFLNLSELFDGFKQIVIPNILENFKLEFGKISKKKK